jgi:glutamyl-tRNA synthetase
MNTAERFDQRLEQATRLAAGSARGRYAPSPTGPLHLGNIRTALLAWLQARLANGEFILRMEDLDQPRVVPGSAEQIMADLRWLGLDWDEGPDIGGPVGPYDQATRDDFYTEALHRLKLDEKLFPCFCSRKDIARAASAPHREDPRGIYPGTCRATRVEHIERLKKRTGREPAWRYRVHDTAIEFDDQVAGHVIQALNVEAGDFVVRRADALFAYQLAVVVDDALMGITDVVRGLDLLDSTPRQIELFRALRFPVPRFWHVPLLHDAAGTRLSKRGGADSLQAHRRQGRSAAHVIGQLACSLNLIDLEQALSARELLEALTPDSFRQKLQTAIADDIHG